MSRDRYALLGLGRARSAWLGEVSRWSTSGAIPADFAKCVSINEVRQRLNSLQPFSALIVESGIGGVDRDLVETARRAGVVTFVVDSAPDAFATWSQIGTATTLTPDLTPADLLYALSTYASVITPVTSTSTAATVEYLTAHVGRMIAVCGPGGTGASTTAIALAQAIADDPLESGLVALADLTLNAEMAMLHDAGDVIPGVEELVETHRGRRPTSDEVRSLTFSVVARGYRLLLGLRQQSAWSALPPKAVEESIAGLRRTFRTVVADITGDFEGEAQSGSVDVEERNSLARITAGQADVVVVVGTYGMKGTHSLARVIRSVLGLGVEEERILPVVTRGPKRARHRAEVSKALAALVHHNGLESAITGPIFLPDRNVELSLRDGTRIHQSITTPLRKAVDAVASQVEDRRAVPDATEPERIAPGSLGIYDPAVGE